MRAWLIFLMLQGGLGCTSTFPIIFERGPILSEGRITDATTEFREEDQPSPQVCGNFYQDREDPNSHFIAHGLLRNCPWSDAQQIAQHLVSQAHLVKRPEDMRNLARIAEKFKMRGEAKRLAEEAYRMLLDPSRQEAYSRNKIDDEEYLMAAFIAREFDLGPERIQSCARATVEQLLVYQPTEAVLVAAWFGLQEVQQHCEKVTPLLRQEEETEQIEFAWRHLQSKNRHPAHLDPASPHRGIEMIVAFCGDQY